MGNFEEAYLEQPEVKKPVNFSIQLKLDKPCTIGEFVLNQIVADLADQYSIKIDGVDLRVNVLSTGHFDDGSIAVKCSAVLAAEEEVDPDDLPVED